MFVLVLRLLLLRLGCIPPFDVSDRRELCLLSELIALLQEQPDMHTFIGKDSHLPMLSTCWGSTRQHGNLY